MPVKKKNIHRGEILAQVADTSDLSVMQIARRAGYKTRRSFYDHIENPNLSFEILAKYAKIFQHDFSEEIPGMPKLNIEEPAFDYRTAPKTLDDALQIIDKLKERNYELLEKYNASLERERDLKNQIVKLESKK